MEVVLHQIMLPEQLFVKQIFIHIADGVIRMMEAFALEIQEEVVGPLLLKTAVFVMAIINRMTVHAADMTRHLAVAVPIVETLLNVQTAVLLVTRST